MKRNIIIILIAACVAVTWYVDSTVTLLDSALKSRVEAAVMADERFPARPVWWENDSVLAVGIVAKLDESAIESESDISVHDDDAHSVCDILKGLRVGGLLVELYDVVKIQRQDDWVRVGAARCAKLD